MKFILRLTILVAALLLVSNMVFAACDQERCYNVTATDQIGIVSTGTWRVCLNDNGTGFLKDIGSQYLLRLFGGGPGWFNTSGYPGAVNGDPKFTAWILHQSAMSFYIQPLEGGAYIAAIGLGGNGSVWFSTNGVEVPLSSCSVTGFD
jgi:hypothetical protein